MFLGMRWRSDLKPSMKPRRQELWRSLVEATLKSISMRGYPATTVSHITEIAGINRTQFYFLFQDKEDCFLATQDAVFSEIEARIQEVDFEGMDWPARVQAAVDVLLKLFDEESALARVALVESAIAGPEAESRQSAVRERLMPHIEAGRELVPRSRKLPESIADMALGSAVAVIEKELRSRKPKFQPLAPEVFVALLMPFVGPTDAMKRMRQAYPGSRSSSRP